MKLIATLTILTLFTACASSTDVIDQRSLLCGPGQDIEVRAGLDDGSINNEVGGEMKYVVEVANNSHDDIYVKTLQIVPTETGDRESQIDRAAKDFDQLIAAGEDHVFELPANAFRNLRTGFSRQPMQRVKFRVIVSLTNGDSYHCQFEALWR